MTLDEDMSDAAGRRRTFPDRRKYPRYVTNIPAFVEITPSGGQAPIAAKEGLICDISRGGLGLGLTVSTPADPQEVSKMFLQRLTCRVSCHFPGTASASNLSGAIAWVRPEKTDEGVSVRFGISLEEMEPAQLRCLETYLGTKESGD